MREGSKNLIGKDINKALRRVAETEQVFEKNKLRSKELLNRLDELEAKIQELKKKQD